MEEGKKRPKCPKCLVELVSKTIEGLMHLVCPVCGYMDEDRGIEGGEDAFSQRTP